MRISVEKNDAGYTELCTYFKIYFNGELLKYCVTADDVLGYAKVLKRDESGDFVINQKLECVETIELNGLVKIVTVDQ